LTTGITVPQFVTDITNCGTVCLFFNECLNDLMKNFFFVIAAAALVAGCSTTAHPTYTASGKAGYRLVCGGAFGSGDLGGCYEKAGELCADQGYRIQQTSVSSMIIECRDIDPDAVKPQ
jgi:hypothetical protein